MDIGLVVCCRVPPPVSPKVFSRRWAVGVLVFASGCYVMRPSSGAGQTTRAATQEYSSDAVAVPKGYRAELLASGLTFPVGAAFDAGGQLYVVESGYAYGEDFTEPRLLRVDGGGRTSVIASGKTEPLADPVDTRDPQVAHGEKIFFQHCHQCHPHGEGGLGPAIVNKPLPELLMKFQVRHGLGAMPSFGPDKIPPADVDALMAYIKAIRRNPSDLK